LRLEIDLPAPAVGGWIVVWAEGNGRLLTYNEEQRGKSAIAKCLARIQKLREQSIFLIRRFRPAEEIVSFEPNLP
jgi:hypothetical protein